MRSLLVSMLSIACLCSLAFSGEEAAKKAEMAKAHGEMKADAGHMHMPMNNVFMMKEDGSRMAMCGCGKEFAVTDKSPMVQNGGMTMYCCSQECHDHAAKASKEEMEQMMGTWMKGYDAKMGSMAANTMMADGKKMAKCGCGKEFAVTDKSPMICENGVMMYCCSEQCHEMMMKMSAEDRMSAEMKVVKPMKAMPAQSAK